MTAEPSRLNGKKAKTVRAANISDSTILNREPFESHCSNEFRNYFQPVPNQFRN